MTNKELLRIAQEEKSRYVALKLACDTCIPDELIEWIDSIIEIIKERVDKNE